MKTLFSSLVSLALTASQSPKENLQGWWKILKIDGAKDILESFRNRFQIRKSQ